jgi:hypothetical protein
LPEPLASNSKWQAKIPISAEPAQEKHMFKTEFGIATPLPAGRLGSRSSRHLSGVVPLLLLVVALLLFPQALLLFSSEKVEEKHHYPKQDDK